METKMGKKFYCLVLLFFFLIGNLFAQKMETPAEKTNYQNGGTKYQPLMDFVYELEGQTELMNVQKITETLMGRDVVLCILSNPPIYSPADIEKTAKPIVLIVNNVHGSEVAGKDASLEIMRDLVMGDLRPLLDQVVVLNIPTINPDGAEVQRRTNEEGFDMNRDYLKLESQEIQALITKIMNVWKPDIHVDTHHGGSDPYVLTYQTCMNPAGDKELIRFGNEEILPRVKAALNAENYGGFWYSGGRWVDDEPRWSPTSVEPRKQHVYSTLANVVGFLFETPRNSYRLTENGTKVVQIPSEERFKHQVHGEYIGQREMIRFAAERGDDLKRVIAEAKERAIELGNNDADDDQIPIEYVQEKKFDEEFWIAKRGSGRDRNQREFEKVTGGVYTLFTPTRTATRPWGYLLPPQLASVMPLLLEHEISIKKLSDSLEVEVEVYYAKEISHESYFQGHYLKEVKAEKKIETIKLPPGSFFIPSGQQKSNLLCYLLEPETNDNLITWGYLDNHLRVTPKRTEQQEVANQIENPQRRQRRQMRDQKIPIYRLMKKTPMKGVLVKSYNEYDRTRYIQY